ncbi:MAG: metallopeptidase family protein [Candidatus Wildermuthbacteria bacterium]|nr:metallopeptidase family protein [Candidatus Wildermuthbacteria bacterium]
MLKYSREQFEKMVNRALEKLPGKVKKRIENVAVCLEDLPTREQLEETGSRRGDILLGLFEGVSETAWGKGFGNVLPNKITIFQKNIERFADTPEEVEREVRATVNHEIAHHFGWSDREIAEKKRARGLRAKRRSL